MELQKEHTKWFQLLESPEYKWYTLKLKRMLLTEYHSMRKGSEEGRIRYDLLTKILRIPHHELAEIERFAQDIKAQEQAEQFNVDS